MRPTKRLPGFDFESPSIRPLLIVTHHVTVEAQARPINMHWTPEMAQDIAAYHNIDAEQELTALLAEEVAREIDQEIIRGLMNPWVAPGVNLVELDETIEPRKSIRHHFMVERETPIIPLGVNINMDPVVMGGPPTDPFEFPVVRNVQTHLLGLDIEPMAPPQGRLFYFEPQYAVTADPVVLDSGSWYLEDTFESDFVKSRVMREEFPKKKMWETVQLPLVNGRFT